MKITTCATCGVQFGMTDDLYRRRREDGEGFHCPHGHISVFRPSMIDELREQVAELEAHVVQWQRKYAGLYEVHVFEREENRELREQLTTAKLRAAGYKRQWLRVKDLLEKQDL